MITTFKDTCLNTGITKSEIRTLMKKRGAEPDRTMDPSVFSAVVANVSKKFNCNLSPEQIEIAKITCAGDCSSLLYAANSYRKSNINSHIHSLICAVLGAVYVATMVFPKQFSSIIHISGGALIGYVFGAIGRITGKYYKSEQESLAGAAYMIKAAVIEASKSKQ